MSHRVVYRAMAAAALLASCLPAGPARAAACQVIGDSVGVGLGQAMRGCSRSAKVGISSAAAANRIGGGGGWVVASIGSNDFPRGISGARRAQSEARVLRSLSRLAARAGGRLIVVIPSNAARSTVMNWVAAHGARSVSFSAGRDGIHPRSYGDLARRVRGMMGE